MSKIRIKNFGPIKEGLQENEGWIEIKKVTVFIGNQGSGKSTVAKLISTFTWIEKALVRGDYDQKWFEKPNRLKNYFLTYHRLENYFKDNGIEKSIIDYVGDAYMISYKNGSLSVFENGPTGYSLPQIMYVPAERNFIAYVKTPKEIRLSSPSLMEFMTEFDNAKSDLGDFRLLSLPINNATIQYDSEVDSIALNGKDYQVKLHEASSGFQSFVPLYLVSNYLANSVKKQSEVHQPQMTSEERQRFKKGYEDIWSNESLTEEQKRIAISVLSAKFNKSAFINIVEEPEQNLFPESQQKMLYSLLELNNLNQGNHLVMTTHSPYLINYLTLAVKAATLQGKIKDEKAQAKLNEIVPQKSTIQADDLAIYEMDEQDGSIKLLETYNGLPSDENELNDKLSESNELFAQLLEIQQGL